MKTFVPNYKKLLLVLALDLLVSLALFAQQNPELVFRNPVLVKGTGNKEGAVYSFANVTTGVDAELKLKKFSRKEIVVATVDNSVLGFDKALQPEFGLEGTIASNQNWYIDFQLVFYKAGTNQRIKLSKLAATALDIDGDGHTISEYYQMSKADSVKFSPNSYLTQKQVQSHICAECGKESQLHACSNCGGTGNKNFQSQNKPWEEDQNCNGTGLLHNECGHAFSGENMTELNTTVNNFQNIDTSATQVMATYFYSNQDQINLRIGARTGSRSSGGAGVRLNSVWFKTFNLKPAVTLPVHLLSFSAAAKQDAVELVWETEKEENFSHFVIERSTGSGGFTPIAIVFSKEQTIVTKYTYTDKKPGTQATINYRLAMVDKDKQTRYSHVRTVKRGQPETLSITAYPNPATSVVKLSLPQGWQGKEVSIELYNSAGSRLQAVHLGNAGPGYNMQLSGLGQGFYVVKAACRDQVIQERIIKN